MEKVWGIFCLWSETSGRFSTAKLKQITVLKVLELTMEFAAKNTNVETCATNNNTSAIKIEELVGKLVYVSNFTAMNIKEVPEIMESQEYFDNDIDELRGWLYDIVLEQQFDNYSDCGMRTRGYLREFLISEESINFNWHWIEMSAENSVFMVINKKNELIFGYDWYSILHDNDYSDNERIQNECYTVGVYQIDCQDAQST